MLKKQIYSSLYWNCVTNIDARFCPVIHGLAVFYLNLFCDFNILWWFTLLVSTGQSSYNIDAYQCYIHSSALFSICIYSLMITEVQDGWLNLHHRNPSSSDRVRPYPIHWCEYLCSIVCSIRSNYWYLKPKDHHSHVW